MAPTETRSLVLHQFLSLRRAGLSALDALNRLVDGTPDGAERAACREAALSLSAVDGPKPGKEDDLVRVLADRSDDLERAVMLAGSYEAASELSAARRSGVLMFQVMFAGPFFLFAAMSVFMGTLGVLWGNAPNAATAALKAFLDVMRIIGVPGGIFLVLLLSRWTRVPVFGAKSLEASRALYVAASHGDPLEAAGSIPLERNDRAVLVTLGRRVNPQQVRGVVLEVARSLEREGRRRVEVHRMLSTLMLSFFAVFIVAAVVVLAYLPIFSIAGTIE